MKREHSIDTIPFYEDLIFYAPLTESGLELIGNRNVTPYGNVNYGENGAEFNGSCLEYEFEYTDQKAPLTICFEFCPTTITNSYDYVLVFGSRSNGSTYRYGIFMRKSDGKIAYDVTCSSNRLDVENYTGITYSSGRRYKVVSVLDANSQKIYIDDVLVYNGSVTDRYQITGTLPGTLVIGGRVDCVYDRMMNGSVKDVRIYNRALSEEEISQL